MCWRDRRSPTGESQGRGRTRTTHQHRCRFQGGSRRVCRRMKGREGTENDERTRQAALRTRISMCSPAAVAMFTSASRLNRLILPRIRSEIRG